MFRGYAHLIILLSVGAFSIGARAQSCRDLFLKSAAMDTSLELDRRSEGFSENYTLSDILAKPNSVLDKFSDDLLDRYLQETHSLKNPSIVKIRQAFIEFSQFTAKRVRLNLLENLKLMVPLSLQMYLFRARDVKEMEMLLSTGYANLELILMRGDLRLYLRSSRSRGDDLSYWEFLIREISTGLVKSMQSSFPLYFVGRESGPKVSAAALGPLRLDEAVSLFSGSVMDRREIAESFDVALENVPLPVKNSRQVDAEAFVAASNSFFIPTKIPTEGWSPNQKLRTAIDLIFNTLELSQLSSMEHTAFKMVFVQGRTTLGVARELGIKPDMVQTYYDRALAILSLSLQRKNWSAGRASVIEMTQLYGTPGYRPGVPHLDAKAFEAGSVQRQKDIQKNIKFRKRVVANLLRRLHIGHFINALKLHVAFNGDIDSRARSLLIAEKNGPFIRDLQSLLREIDIFVAIPENYQANPYEQILLPVNFSKLSASNYKSLRQAVLDFSEKHQNEIKDYNARLRR